MAYLGLVLGVVWELFKGPFLGCFVGILHATIGLEVKGVIA